MICRLGEARDKAEVEVWGKEEAEAEWVVTAPVQGREETAFAPVVAQKRLIRQEFPVIP